MLRIGAIYVLHVTVIARRVLPVADRSDVCTTAVSAFRHACRLFIILVVTACGLCIPLLTKGYTKIFFLARTFGAGASSMHHPNSQTCDTRNVVEMSLQLRAQRETAPNDLNCDG